MLSIKNCQIENESSVNFPLTKDEYYGLLNDEFKKEYVLHFEEFRLSRNVMMIKNVQTKLHVLGFYDMQVYPIVRKVSVEKTLQYSPYVNIKVVNLVPTLVITRTILFEEEKLRISLDKIESNHGIKYCLLGEIEYENVKDSFTNELVLLSKLSCFDQVKNIVWDKASASLLNSSGTKLLDVVVFDPNVEYKWAFKWDGIKHKFVRNVLENTNDGILMNDVGKQLLVKTDFPFYNLLCHVEELDDRFVLFEVLNATLNDEVYKMPLEYNIVFLDSFKDVIYELGNKPMVFQKFFNQPFTPLIENTDGHVIIQRSTCTTHTIFNAIKHKYPTIDGLYVGNGTFKFGNKFSIHTDIKTCIPGEIYELTMSNSKFIKLRSRQKDRIAPSSLNELSNFLYAISLFSSN